MVDRQYRVSQNAFVSLGGRTSKLIHPVEPEESAGLMSQAEPPNVSLIVDDHPRSMPVVSVW